MIFGGKAAMPVTPLSDDFLRGVAAAARANGVRGSDWLLVMYAESTLDPAAHTDGSCCYGLTQIRGEYLQARGIDPETFRTWTAEAQLPVSASFLHSQVHGFYGGRAPESAAVVWALNIAPAFASRGPSPDAAFLVASSADAREARAYASNASLDVNRDGIITFGDLGTWLARKATEPPFQAALARYVALGGDGAIVSVPAKGAGAGALALAVAAAVAVTMLRRR